MKRTNSKKGLAALMAAVMGVSMFTVAGAGIVNAKGDKESDEKKPKKSVQISFDDYHWVKSKNKVRIHPELSALIRVKQLKEELKKTLLKDIDRIGAMAKELNNSRDEIAASLMEVKENFYDKAVAELNALEKKIESSKTLSYKDGQDEEAAMKSIYTTYSDGANKRLEQIEKCMYGGNYCDVVNHINDAINRKNALEQYFNNDVTINERAELNDIENVLDRSMVDAKANCYSETTLAAIKNKIIGTDSKAIETISQRLSKLEGIKNGSYYIPVKLHIINLKARVDSINMSAHELIEERNNITIELDELTRSLEAKKYSVADVKTISDLAKECESRIVSLEKKVNLGFPK